MKMSVLVSLTPNVTPYAFYSAVFYPSTNVSVVNKLPRQVVRSGSVMTIIVICIR